MAEHTDGIDRAASYAEALEAQGRALRRLRAERGLKSYSAIDKRALALTGEREGFPKATLHAAFSGQYVGIDRLMLLVRTLMSWDEYGEGCTVVPHRAQVLAPWRSDWSHLAAMRPAPRSVQPSSAEKATKPAHASQPEDTRIYISYAGPDRPWAEWVAWQLQQAGHQVLIDVWDWRTGDDFHEAMAQGLAQADAVVALFSNSYFETHRWTNTEIAATLARGTRLIPLCIEHVPHDHIPEILAKKLRKDLWGLDEAAAVAAVLDAVGRREQPRTAPTFPGASSGGG
ncbi:MULTISPECIES: toll/interleukin-1 receptor domain-containing protein [Streptomyces]|uniref:toll/interleukin-1 receptor domain-containing protein n=1 Tax=Streptomyces TaxID=1883 RepID=UPI000A3CDB41|nr:MULTISPECIES: toll/interleukin-1 receptor domain-containing protein [Streptomyces]MDX3617765.1 toll/interleukin-1 receptor domain-containing protein [Streptomyces europaeiscabiei]MDX3636449.1 toll/interleukin-1 receptor domain-containing protein [Streptomyces europaeiscabiei]MDX3654456.1 toll/interleukin-1 receptor domain-containing protein [Streptomyces europaeiscabiei]